MDVDVLQALLHQTGRCIRVTYMLKKVLNPYHAANRAPRISGFSAFVGAGAANIHQLSKQRAGVWLDLVDCRDQHLEGLQRHYTLRSRVSVAARVAANCCGWSCSRSETFSARPANVAR